MPLFFLQDLVHIKGSIHLHISKSFVHLEESWANYKTASFLFSFTSQVLLYFSALKKVISLKQFLSIISFFFSFSYLISDFNVSQRYHEFFSCFTKGKTKNNKWNTLWNLRGSSTRKILFADDMDIRCRNSHTAKSSDEFTPTSSLSGRMLCTFISGKRKLSKSVRWPTRSTYIVLKAYGRQPRSLQLANIPSGELASWPDTAGKKASNASIFCQKRKE